MLPGYNLQPKYIVDMGEKRSFYGRRVKVLSFFRKSQILFVGINKNRLDQPILTDKHNI